jgi:hypothetical protein
MMQKGLFAKNIGERLLPAPAGHELPVLVQLLGRQRLVKMHVKLHTIALKHSTKQYLRVQTGVFNPLVREILPGPV